MFIYDKKNCLVNLSNSILKRFNAPTFHDSINEVDGLLAKHKKIVLFLCDGMGKNVLNANKEETKDLNAHAFRDITSTFPPTTVAATNALLSGKFPNEIGWLSWSQPFFNWERCIDVFPGTDSQTGEKVPGFNYRELAYFPTIADQINKANNKTIAQVMLEFPIDQEGHVGIKQCTERVAKFFSDKEEGFVYGYVTEPDHSSHTYGITSPEVKAELVNINNTITEFANAHPEILVLVIADHGHINVDELFLEDYPDFVELLDKPMCFEGRAANFKVKEGKNKQFEDKFNQYFGKYFELYTKEQVIADEFYGPNPMPKQVENMIGDYIAVAISNVILIDLHIHDFFKGHHAGGTVEEGVIQICAYNK